MTLHAYIPSPSQGVWHLGPLPVRAYALFIIAGIVLAIWICDHRWQARGGSPTTVGQIATWAVPFGLVGGRLYHVITDPELYFEHGEDWVHVFYVWNGGLGIWGAIALGALGAWIACRRAKVSFPAFADALAPGVVLAQALGRWGNYFNQELYGKPSGMPWALRIDPEHRVAKYTNVATYQPTFLYESLWDIGTAILVLWADRRYKMGHGRAFLLYVMAYVAGRSWIEYLRVDTANHILGLRLNDWTCMIVFVGALVTFLISLRRSPGRETVVEFNVPAVRGADAPAPSDSSASPTNLAGSEETSASQASPDDETRAGEPPGYDAHAGPESRRSREPRESRESREPREAHPL
jgi:prolipoprotein diacylglyceryl transferase